MSPTSIHVSPTPVLFCTQPRESSTVHEYEYVPGSSLFAQWNVSETMAKIEEDPDLAFARRLQAEQQSPRGSNPFDSGRQPHVAGNPFA